MATFETSYQQYQPFDNVEDSEETPHSSGVMIHVVPDSGKASRWNHIEDLDTFFHRVYSYHQRHGLVCMVVQQILELAQFAFVVTFSLFLLNCVNYPLLFGHTKRPPDVTKLTVWDVLYSTDESLARFSALEWSITALSACFWLLRLFKVLYHFVHYCDIKAFFNQALKIHDSDLDNVTWHEVLKRLREVQLEQQMCIHKRDLSELDIYHRILRFKNYLVAMVNKTLLPVKLTVPFLGEVTCLSHGLRYNYELLLFWGPLSPWVNNWHLKEDYKKVSKRQQLAASLSKYITYVAVANLLLCPLILLWQILYSFFNYAELVKRQPGALGTRCWSSYGRLYLRHFNELEHELNARLNRAYRPATKYMNVFTSPLLTILSKHIVFVAGAMLIVLGGLSIYDEDVLTVEHVLTAITILGAVVAGFRALIPDDNLVYWPEQLMSTILAHVHYLPDEWKGQAHTHDVKHQFSHLFQYKFSYLLLELVSPLVTPMVLLFWLRPRSLDMVDFFRNFTVEVAGVGDVCAFAQMDIRVHGDPAWSADKPSVQPLHTNQYNKAEEGKTELSLIHFTLTNPTWAPPKEAEQFLTRVKSEAKTFGADTDLSLSTVTHGLRSMLPTTRMGDSSSCVDEGLLAGLHPPGTFIPSGGLTHVSTVEGPAEWLPPPIQPTIGGSLGGSLFGAAPEQVASLHAELTAVDMSITTLYLHHLHHRGRRPDILGTGSIQTPGERLPLLRHPHHSPT